jgi:phospholipase/carboxylesterase
VTAHVRSALDAIEIETGPSPRCAVVWLHGLGADGNDFVPIVPQLVGSGWIPIRFVFPHAPIRPVTINGGMRMRAWYDIRALTIDRDEDEPGILESRRLISALLERERARGIAPSRLFLAGFSQGGAMTLVTGLTNAEAIGGLVVLSAYLPIPGRVEREHRAIERTPVFMGHGRFDPIVPIGLGSHARDWVAARGHPVAWHDYPMAHAVCPEEIRDLRAWLSARMM